MKLQVSEDVDLVQEIRAQLRTNDNYCPCVLNSKGKQEYKCPCKQCREEIAVGEYCHCGLYKKVEA